MKGFQFSVFFILSINIILAQTISGKREGAKGIDIGVIGGINSTWLFNSNVSDSKDELNYEVTFGGSIGFKGILNFNEKIAISIGILYSGHNQAYTGSLVDSSQFPDKLRLTYLDIPILLRLQSPRGPYLEVGPQIGFLLDAKSSPENKSLIIQDYFKSSNLAALLGFGFDFEASEKIGISTGLRFGYGLTDATSNDKSLFLIYKPTDRVFGGFVIGAVYKLFK